MIDGIGWAGKVGSLCAGCTAAVFSKLEENGDRERVCESEGEKESEGEVEQKARGGQKEDEEEKQVYLPLALQADQVSAAPR